ncbi:MAG: hypothetical protein P0S96_07735 [Simkaniaceae bacterium]|nr:hypothetical protein [Candidatus Sacchlamyda saccharinae]
MKVDFHTHVVSGYTPEEAAIAYKNLADHHLQVVKRLSKSEFLCWKIAGIFLAMVILTMILQDKGLVTNASLLILIAGFGGLFVFSMNTKKDLALNAEATNCVQRGILIERQQKVSAGIFQMLETNKKISHNGFLLSRMIILWLLGLTSTGAGAILCLQRGLWLALLISLLSVAILFFNSYLYVKIAKKTLLEASL